MRKTISVAALLLALTCPAYAGEMQNDKPAPPPQPASVIQEPTDGATVDGEMHTPPLSESLTQTVLDLLAVLL
jgi:hypothetical protein